MTTLIIITFIIGYLFIALESVTKVNKSAVALLLCVCCWGLYALGGYADEATMNHTIEENLGEASTTLFFLMGAMTIVEIVDQYGGFNFVRRVLHSRTKRSLMWKIGFMTMLLSAVLDNLTTSIVMIMILRKLVSDHTERIWFASLIIIAANAGGAFSPIGDVTTIMLWNGKMITASGVIKEIFIPSLLAFVIPAFFIQFRLNGALPESNAEENVNISDVTVFQRNLVFVIGVGGLCLVPLFHSLTSEPAFVGILLVLAFLWVTTEMMYWRKGEHDPMSKRVSQLLSHIDMATILFFLGILMAVSVLSEIGVLSDLGKWFDVNIGNNYLVTGAIGILSSIVDNVPLVAGAMKMYVIDPTGGAMGVDGVFWQLLAYCAGTGGSLLIIGSAAGVVVMGLERITFGWYMRNITPIAFLGYLVGIVSYWLMNI